MIILITLATILYLTYAFWVIDWASNKFNTIEVCMLVSFFCITMPVAILMQILISIGVVK